MDTLRIIFFIYRMVIDEIGKMNKRLNDDFFIQSEYPSLRKRATFLDIFEINLLIN